MRLISVSFFLFLILGANAQNYTYKEKFVEGNYLVLEENYPKALENFLEAYKLDSLNANINYLIGFCYIKSAAEKTKAAYYLKKAATNVNEKYVPFEAHEKGAPINVYYYLGAAHHLTYKIDSAIINYKKYLTYLSPTKQADLRKEVTHQIDMCQNAKEYLALPTNISITNLGDSVNSAYPDYSPVITADESTLIFTSRRPGSTGDDRTNDDQFYEDIYICHRKDDGTWSSPVLIGSSINTPAHEATIGLTADGYQLFIYKDDGGDGNIYSSTLEGEIWSAPEKMGSDINTTAWEPSACVTPDGNTLYFVSDRNGGYGGRDLYKCVRLPNGNWSLATNMGPTLNTEYDEDAPFIHPDRVTLFFSSNGHSSMGGFDIFYTTKNDSGWTTPTNLLPPINTPDDDIFYVSSTDGKRAYYSSGGKDSRGDKDLYMISLETSKVSSVALIIGKIIPVEGKPLPKDLEITITDLETGEIGVYKANAITGKYVLPLMPGKTYSASYTIDNEEFFKEEITVPAGSDYKEIEKEIFLDPVKLQESMRKAMEKALEKANNKNQKPDENKNTNTNKPLVNNNENKNVPVKENKVVENKKPAEAKNYTEKTYKVQISSVKKPALYDAFSIKGVRNVEYRKTDNGWYIYYVGTFKSAKEAKKLKEEMIAKGFDDAIVVPFSGALIPFDDTAPGKSSQSDNSSSLSTVSDKQFEMFFKYNVVEVNINDENYKSFIKTLVAKIQSQASVTLSMTSSASNVPTRAFNSNRELAADRAANSKDKIINSARENGIDGSKIIFKAISSSVNGPAYNNDYLVNKSAYEKFQYVRITIE